MEVSMSTPNPSNPTPFRTNPAYGTTCRDMRANIIKLLDLYCESVEQHEVPLVVDHVSVLESINVTLYDQMKKYGVDLPNASTMAMPYRLR
jgi:hypothetical protein